MLKNELRKLRALNATPRMMEKAKLYDIVEDRRYRMGKIEPYSRKKYKYTQLIRVQNLKGYIKIAVFFPEWMNKGIVTPRYEIFVNAAGSEWITRELDKKGKESRWSKAMVKNLDGIYIGYWSNKREKTYANQDAKRTLSKLRLDNPNINELSMLRRLDTWQQQAVDHKTQIREQKEQEPWDKDMALVPKIVPSFEEWMRKETPDEYYIFYEYKRNQKIGFCSRCHQYVPIKEPKHRKETKCPRCKVKAEFISSGKIKSIRIQSYGEIIQKIKDGIVVRRFRQTQSYWERDYTKPSIYTIEIGRDLIFNDGTHKKYSWESYKNKFLRWIPREWSYHYSKTKLYKRNLSKIDAPIIKHSAFQLWDKLPGPLIDYLSIERKHPVIEMLARIGMFRLSKELYGMPEYQWEDFESGPVISEKNTELHKILCIDKSRLSRLRTIDGNITALRWLQNEKGMDTVWPDEMIRDYSENGLDICDFEDNMPIGISFVKAYNYLKKQSLILRETLNQTFIIWTDFLDMAEKLKMNISLSQINRPKNLKAAHDECILLREAESMEKQAKQIEKKWEKVNSQLPKLKKYEYKNGDYQIIAPEKIVDIVKEGTILKHCVHTCDYYFDRIQRDESYLFFLRHSDRPDMPWYTLEVEPSGNIRQKRTTGDNQNADFQEAVAFLKKWQKFFRKQLTKEEKKLGDKANKARIKNYEELRKNENRVWHGKLAGQLLADVLEADFMEVS